MEKAYAQALWQMVSSGMNETEAVRAMHARLEKDGRASLMPRIARAFERIAERNEKKTAYVLTVARESDVAHAKKEIKAFTGEIGEDSADLKTQVDASLIGGWRLEGNERLVDASYKQRLLDLYNSVTRA